MAVSPSSDDPGQEQPFISHLLELRDRVLHMVVAVFAVFLLLFPFANDIYVYVASPLMAQLPEGTSMIATQVASPFLTPFKLALVSAVFVSMPYILHQVWAFVAPGLYQHEKRLAVPLLVSSVMLFYLGMLFAYYIVFPLVFAFLTGTAPEGVAVMTDITAYLDFVLTLFFAFGVAFEIPIATILLVWIGITTPESLASKRPYIIVGVFVIGMLLTPPDIISQTLLAFPMWLLFELGIILSRVFLRQREARERAQAEAEAAYASAPGAAGSGGTQTAKASPNGHDEAAVGADISGGDPYDEERFVPMTEEELEAELDAIEAAEEQAGPQTDGQTDDPIEHKLRRVQALRDQADHAAARKLLYEVLEAGNEAQRRVARNILAQLDSP